MLRTQFEASDNKGVVIGYSVGAVFAFFFAEWFIHLPLFNVVSSSLLTHLKERRFDSQDVGDDLLHLIRAANSSGLAP